MRNYGILSQPLDTFCDRIADIANTSSIAGFSAGPDHCLAAICEATEGNMMISLKHLSPEFRPHRLVVLGLVVAAAGTASLMAQFQYHAVPGRGQKATEVGDDFEEAEWTYIDNVPKSSTNLDRDDRLPAGISKNQRVYESTYRGQPDVIKQVPTSSRRTAGKQTCRCRCVRKCGRPRPSQPPDAAGRSAGQPVVDPGTGSGFQVAEHRGSRVPPPIRAVGKTDRTTFGFRAELEGGSMKMVSSKGWFSKGQKLKHKHEAYWPGFFIQFNSKSDGQNKRGLGDADHSGRQSGRRHRRPEDHGDRLVDAGDDLHPRRLDALLCQRRASIR